MESLTSKQLKALMAYLNTDLGLTREERIRLYGKIFDKRYICEDCDEIAESRPEENLCPECEEEMIHDVPHSTKHLSKEDASLLLDSFNKMPDKTEERIRKLVSPYIIHRFDRKIRDLEAEDAVKEILKYPPSEIQKTVKLIAGDTPNEITRETLQSRFHDLAIKLFLQNLGGMKDE